MKAIILAAGAGANLSRLNGDRPTCLMEIGSTTLLNTQIDTLYRCGVTEIVIVRGHEKARIDVPGVRYYDNDEYRTTNVLYSLLTAEAELEGDVLVLYSDIYYEESCINILLQSSHDITLGGLVSHEALQKLKEGGALGDVELIDFSADNAVTRIGKRLPAESAGTRGQFIGILKLNGAGCRKFKNFLELYKGRRDADGDLCYRRAFITDMLSLMTDCGINLHTTIVESGWFEVNTPEDFQLLLRTHSIRDKYLATTTDWARRSEKYDRLEWVNNDELLRHFADCVEGLGPDSHLLDVGTGTGKVLIYLKLKKGDAHYYGIDSSPAMMSRIDPSYGFHLRRADVTDLEEFPDGLFDYVTARMVLHHVDDLDLACQQIYRKLKSGGRLVVCEGNPPSYDAYNFYKEMFFYKEIRNTFMESDLINMQLRNGFRNVTTKCVVLRDMSLNNWIDNSGLPQRNINIIKQMHYECSDIVKRDYNMKTRGDDITMDWKFSVVIGEK